MSEHNPYDALLKIGAELNNLNGEPDLLERVMDIAISTLEAERGFILLKSTDEAAGFTAATARNINQESIDSLRQLSSSVVNMVLDNGESLLSFDALSDERFSSSESVMFQKIRSIACVPIRDADNIAGAIYLDTLTRADRFTQDSLHFLEAFAAQSALALANIRQLHQLRSENERLKQQLRIPHEYPDIIGESKEIAAILDTVSKVADSKVSVLIEGESGTGKELIARALHARSSRKDEAIVTVFCAGLTESLLESELFGHKKGAFTGAYENRTGLFEEADNGTIFLDEIGDISISMQTKLLRVIQEGEIKRVGESKVRMVNVRILSATNKDLWKEVQQRNFREDLYYRLNVLSIKLPPLRDRGNDIQVLANHFLRKFARENGKSIRGFSPNAIDSLCTYRWPGNVRELENAIERAVILASGEEITPDLLNLSRTRANTLAGRTLKDIERAAVLETLDMAGNHRANAAETLGVSLRWLQYRIKEWGLDLD